MKKATSDLLNLQQAAAMLGVNPATIRIWAYDNQLKGIKVGSRGDWRFAKVELSKMIHDHNVSGKSSKKIKTKKRKKLPNEEFLSGGGEMGKFIRSKDWSKTPLGPVEKWPQSLRTTVSLCLASNFPISIAWGKKRTQIYNDGYWPICGDKHPKSMGQDFKECWLSAWPVIGRSFEDAKRGKTRFLTNQRIFIDRYGYLEETFFTFSFSPIRDETGNIAGLFHPVIELTQQSLGERRLNVIHELAENTSNARTVEEASRLIVETLAKHDLDVPFMLLYVLSEDETQAQLIGNTGLKAGTQVSPKTVDLKKLQHEEWPIAEVARNNQTILVEDLAERFESFSCGPYPQQPKAALIMPISVSGLKHPFGVFVAGVSLRRELDKAYRTFYDLLSESVINAITNARSYEEERKRAEALAEIDRAKTVFFSNVSHEFRTPLTLMLGPIEDALNEADTLAPQQKERIETLHRNSLRLLKLVNTLLDFSRIEAGRVQAVYTPTDLSKLTASLASNFRSAIEKARMKLIIKTPKMREKVYVDREMWEKIVLNLLSNAFKYTLKGKVTVLLKENKGSIELSVSDTGVGIPKEELPHMFERFHRVKGTEGRTHEGTGIGLSLVQELVKLHGGTISVNSTEGVGSTFTVSVPKGYAHLPKEHVVDKKLFSPTSLGAQDFVEDALRLLPGHDEFSDVISDLPLEETLANDKKLPNGQLRQKPRILLAEDNADMRSYIKRLLSQKYAVEAVPDGKAALSAIKKLKPDLVLKDVMMSHLDGFGLLKKLRSNPQTKTLPIVMLSARAGEEANVEGMEAGADDYLIKPFSARELMARVSSRLEMASVRKEAQEAVRVERQRLYEVFMQAPAIIAVFHGPEHVFELANPLYMQLIGKDRDIIGKPLAKAIHEAKEQGFIELLDNVYNTGKPFIGREIPVKPDRSGGGNLEEVFLNFVYQPYKDAEGKTQGIMVHAVDVTETVSSRKHIELLSRQKDEFIGIASHELKTPVTSIKAYTQVLQSRFRKAEDLKSAEMVTKMDGQLDKLTSLIADLLDVTKIEGGKLQFHEEYFDFNELAEEIIEEMQRTTTKHTIIQEFVKTKTVFGDRDRIGQVITNLLSNGIKYSPHSDKIIVKTRTEKAWITLSVQDFGVGISKEEQAKVFERFSRVGEKETYPGLGLGLYISAEIIKRQGGKIWVESRRGKGSTFSFSLPLKSGRKGEREKVKSLFNE